MRILINSTSALIIVALFLCGGLVKANPFGEPVRCVYYHHTILPNGEIVLDNQPYENLFGFYRTCPVVNPPAEEGEEQHLIIEGHKQVIGNSVFMKDHLDCRIEIKNLSIG